MNIHPTRQNTMLVVRDATSADYPAIREVVIAAYRQYAGLIAPDIFSAYLADLDRHARHGRLFVVEADQWICAFAAWYPDASVQGVGLPPGWASGRALAVHPAARGNGAARALMATGERLAREARAPVLAFHTVSFMTGAIACTSDSATAGRRSLTTTGPPTTAGLPPCRSRRSPSPAT